MWYLGQRIPSGPQITVRKNLLTTDVGIISPNDSPCLVTELRELYFKRNKH
jgi:hypothetical protein